MQKVTATYEVVTPMFLGGGESEAGTLRASSIKSELVFWWRALRFGHLVISARGDIESALKQLHSEECEIFGSPGGGRDAKQSAVLVKARWVGGVSPNVAKSSESIVKAFDGTLKNFYGVKYLGYGLMDFRGNIQEGKSCFAAASQFKMTLAYRALEPEQLTYLMRATKIMGMLGGLGARKRRGWGSLTLKSIHSGDEPPEVLPTDPHAWSGALGALINCPDVKSIQFPLSAFGSGCRIERWRQGQVNSLSAMELLGAGYQQYRGWGRKDNQGTHRLTTGEKADQLFESDHEWFRGGDIEITGRRNAALAQSHFETNTLHASNNAASLPRRGNMGLPLQFQGGGPALKIEGPGHAPRRASPLLFHIAKIGEQFFPVATWFNCQFMPSPMQIVVNKKQGEEGKSLAAKTGCFEPDSSVVENFLNENQKHNAGRRYFDGVPVDLTGKGAQ